MIMLTANFFKPEDRISKYPITESPANYKRGTANFTPDSSKLVNRLIVRGGKALSDPYDQAITVGTDPIPLNYTPRAPDGESVVVVIGGAAKTIGIQNIAESGVYDFLLNANEKLLVPDLCTSGTGTITYRYEYPIKIVLEDAESQTDYGFFDDILTVDTDDQATALDMGLRHLAKYSRPVTRGTIEPFSGSYRPGQLVLVDIPSLNISEYLQVSEATYDSIPGQSRVDIKLTLESPARDLPSVLKDLNARLAKLEKSVYQDDEGPVLKYIAPSEGWGWSEVAELPPPVAVTEQVNWSEASQRVSAVSVSEQANWTESTEAVAPIPLEEQALWTEDMDVTQYSLVPADDLYPADGLYPM